MTHSRLTSLFFAVSFLQALDNQLIPVLLDVLEKEMGKSDAGHLLTAYALACGLIPFLATAGSKARNIKPMALAALVTMAGAAFVFGAVSSFPIRIAMRAAAGAASGILSITLLLAAARTEDARARARRFTVINAGYLCALVLGVPLGAVLVKHFQVSTVYWGIGGLALLLCALFTRTAAVQPAASEADPRRSIIRLFHHRQAALILLATGMVGAAMAGPVGFLGKFLASARGMGIDAIGAVYMWAGVGPLLAMPIASRTIARFGPDRVAIAGSLVIGVPIFAFPELATSLMPAALVMLACVFVETIRRAALQASLSAAAPPPDLPRYLALRGVIVQVGLAIGYALANAQMRSFGFGVVCGVAAILSTGAAIVLFAATRRPTAAPPAHHS